LATKEGKSLSVSLKQPSGIMGAEVSVENGEITSLYITGKVSIVAKGTAYI